jgi:hypothetical protein
MITVLAITALMGPTFLGVAIAKATHKFMNKK